MVQLRRSSSEGSVATQNAVDQTADEGNAVARAIVVAAGVIDRSRAVAAAVSGNVATAGANPRMSARMSAYCVSAYCVSATVQPGVRRLDGRQLTHWSPPGRNRARPQQRER